MTVIEGIVQHGQALGRRLGFPTANLPVDGRTTAPDAVYAARAEVDGTIYRAMANLGCNPSVGGVPRRLEVHLFGFDAPLYGKRLRVGLLRRIRGERRSSRSRRSGSSSGGTARGSSRWRTGRAPAVRRPAAPERPGAGCCRNHY